MDKRVLATRFSARLREVLDSGEGGTAAFVRDTGIDRSALSQFLDPDCVRLPRAESLRNIATARGVSVDWLLDLENAPDGRQQVASSLEIESAIDDDVTPLHRWRREAEGHKLRYVPSTLPDMLSLSSEGTVDEVSVDVRGEGVENVLEGVALGEMDIEIAMPIQTLEDLKYQTGLWRNTDSVLCERQLLHIATVCEEAYPALRLHLYDGTQMFSAPFTVFGKLRVAIYIGEAYVVITTRDQINTFVQRFDSLVRHSLMSSDKVGETLRNL